MKKSLSICLVMLMCLFICTTALAASERNITPQGIIGLSCGMPKVSGNQYNPWASATAGLPEQITVGFSLYRVAGGSEVYVTSASKSANSNYVEAEDYVTLSAGTYKMYSYYVGETKSDNSTKTFTVR